MLADSFELHGGAILMSMTLALLGSVLLSSAAYLAGAVFLDLHPLPVLATVRDVVRVFLARQTRHFAEAGLAIHPVGFAGLCLLVGGGSGVLFWHITGVWALSLVLGIEVILALYRRVQRARQRRQECLGEIFPDALQGVADLTRNGVPIHQALLRLSKEGAPDTQQIFERYRKLQQHYGEPDRALMILQQEIGGPTAGRALDAFRTCARYGSARVILPAVATSIREGIQNNQEIRSANLENRMEAGVVRIIPLFLFLILVLPIGDMRAYYQSPQGTIVIFVCAALLGVAYWAALRLGQVPEEPEIFSSRTEEAA